MPKQVRLGSLDAVKCYSADGNRARSVLKLAAAKLPVTTEIVDKQSAPKVGDADFAQDAKASGPRVVTLAQAMLMNADKAKTSTEGSSAVEDDRIL